MRKNLNTIKNNVADVLAEYPESRARRYWQSQGKFKLLDKSLQECRQKSEIFHRYIHLKI